MTCSITLGRLGLYELRADSLHLGTRTSLIASDPTPPAAKRVFGIGDPIHIERRALALAHALSTPIEALDLALGQLVIGGACHARLPRGHERRARGRAGRRRARSLRTPHSG